MRNLSRFLAGLIAGALFSALISLLLAPMSGRQMREKINDQAITIRRSASRRITTRS